MDPDFTNSGVWIKEHGGAGTLEPSLVGITYPVSGATNQELPGSQAGASSYSGLTTVCESPPSQEEGRAPTPGRYANWINIVNPGSLFRYSSKFGHYSQRVLQTPVLNLPDVTHTPSTGESSYTLLTPLSAQSQPLSVSTRFHSPLPSPLTRSATTGVSPLLNSLGFHESGPPYPLSPSSQQVPSGDRNEVDQTTKQDSPTLISGPEPQGYTLEDLGLSLSQFPQELNENSTVPNLVLPSPRTSFTTFAANHSFTDALGAQDINAISPPADRFHHGNHDIGGDPGGIPSASHGKWSPSYGGANFISSPTHGAVQPAGSSLNIRGHSQSWHVEGIQLPHTENGPSMETFNESDFALSSPIAGASPVKIHDAFFSSGERAIVKVGRASDKVRAVSEQRRKRDQKHECEICGDRFTSKQNLGNHYNSHSGINPYTCWDCGPHKTYRHSRSLNRHRLNVHGFSSRGRRKKVP